MHDRGTFWLIVMNAALGLVLVLLVVGIVTGVLCDVVAAWRRRRRIDHELDKDMENFFDEHRAEGRHRR